jgi:hypothetical protein
MKKNFFVFLLLIFGVSFPFHSTAYEIETHEFLGQETLNFYNKQSSQKISEELTPFFLEGIRKEDEPPRWMNHFYDPVKNRGLVTDLLIDGSILGTWQSSKNWVNDEDN